MSEVKSIVNSNDTNDKINNFFRIFVFKRPKIQGTNYQEGLFQEPRGFGAER